MIRDHDLLTHPNTRDIFASLPRTKYIIDVGPGIIPCPVFKCFCHILLEPCDEYADILTGWKYDQEFLVLRGEVENIAKFSRKDTTVLMLDVIEHLDRDRGEKIRALLEEFEHAVVFTPLGICVREGKNPDDWGLNGGAWQKHNSTWYPEDFPNWTVTAWNEWKGRMCGTILAVR